MKKSLIAMAVLAASGVASAQSTVTLYGLVDAYVGSTKNKATIGGTSSSLRQTEVGSGGFNTSRFGFKGSEDLGGGLKANFVLEGGFDVSTGAANNYSNPFTGSTSSSTFGRQSWVGLSGGFGEVKIGKMWTPYDEVKGLGGSAFDANIFTPANNAWLSNQYLDRPGNALYYSTPSFGGISAAVMYSFGENKANATPAVGATPARPAQDAGSVVSANIQYAGGPVFVALSHQREEANGNVVTAKFTQVNASYDFGVVKVLGAYGQVKDFAAFGADKSREYQLGVDVPLGGALTVSGGYARSKVDVTGGGEDTRSGFGLAAKYELSKRTFLYTGLQIGKNELAGGGEVKSDTFAAGVQHKF